MKLEKFDGSSEAISTLRSLNLYERSEFRGLLYRIETMGFDIPEALVEVEDGNEIQRISDNQWNVIFRIENKKFNLVIKDKLTDLYLESIKVVY
ncbi:hypothetical protein [Niallia endozanthoxylica]|uniref:Uncharacterized protein n=1 Tax=Niallia endozanthoxylica TaxID=2036016 RepID=A0A5J5GZM4_9BACI|nr:hypothetical protein [Niallia endozanthoxylica]KAA9012844.1 hypothetical protein F4V44_25125 [Niallia endozanthoxylica]